MNSVSPLHATSQAVNTFEVRFTSTEEYIAELKADLASDCIQDNVVRLASRTARATIADLEPDRPQDTRLAPQWRCHYIEVSYISARQQLIKLSCFCGVAMEPWADGREHTEHVVAINEATRRQLLRTMRQVQTAIAKVDGLDIRGGGLFVEEGNWVATPGNEIKALEQPTCATCGVPLHFANQQWRDEDSGFQVLVDQQGRFGPIKALDHIHDPIEAGRKL